MLLGLLVACAAPAPPAAASMVGVYVMAKEPEVGIATAGGKPLGELDPLDAYRVREEKGGKLRVRFMNKEGWVKKADVMSAAEAVKHFGEKLKDDPNDSYYYAARGVARSKPPAADKSGALKDFRKASELTPDESHYRSLLGWHLVELRKFDQAEKVFSRVIEDDPDEAGGYLSRGYARLFAHKLDEAEKDIAKGIEKAESDPSGYTARAKLHALRGEHKEALADAIKAVEVSDEDPSELAARGEAYAALKQFDKADKDYAAALELDPDDPDLFAGRAEACRKAKKYADAKKYWEKAVSLAPYDAWFQRGLADTLGMLKDSAGAKKNFETALALDPTDPDNLNGYAWYLATTADEAARDGNKAVELAEAAVKADPSPTIRDTLAAAYAAAGRFEDAAKEQQAAIKATLDGEELAKMRERLALYKGGKAYRDEP